MAPKDTWDPVMLPFVLFCFFNLFIFGCVGSSLLHAGFSSCGEQGLLFSGVHGFLIAVVSLVVEHRLQERGPQ